MILVAVGANFLVGSRGDRFLRVTRVVRQGLKAPVVCVPSVTVLPFSSPIHVQDFVALSSPFGERDPEDTGGYGDDFHDGLDLYGTWLARIVAARDGVVLVHFLPPGGRYKGHRTLGGLIIVSHMVEDETWYTKYGHLSDTDVHEGDVVSTGQLIGRQGDTGRTDSEHLHFEVIKGGTLNIDTGEITGGERMNPLKYTETPQCII